MKLIIVESPTKARTLGKFLGKDYDVMATTGHIKDLPKSKLGVDIENNFKPDFVEVEKRKTTIKELRSLAKKADAIFIASDPDREGEAIAEHVFEIIEKPNASRISFHEITKEAVEEAISNPRKIDENLVDAQIARRVLDRLVGYKLSPLLWKKVRRGLSAGRVQSVAVRGGEAGRLLRRGGRRRISLYTQAEWKRGQEPFVRSTLLGLQAKGS